MKSARNRLSASLGAAAIAVAATAALTLTGCVHQHHAAPVDVSYSMVAYGENGHCYYIDDPTEATALLAAGLCQPGWVAYKAPLTWEEEYWAYYSSPAYVTVYVPVRSRTVYTTHITTFHTTYSTQITAASKNATYKNSTGATVKPTGTLKFSSGGGTVNNGGNMRGGASAKPSSAPSKAPSATNLGNMRGSAPQASPAKKTSSR